MVGGLPLGADEEEQYKEEQPREGLFLAGAMNCWEEFSHPSLSLSLRDATRSDPSLFLDWPIFSTLGVASPIYRRPGPLPKY